MEQGLFLRETNLKYEEQDIVVTTVSVGYKELEDGEGWAAFFFAGGYGFDLPKREYEADAVEDMERLKTAFQNISKPL